MSHGIARSRIPCASAALLPVCLMVMLALAPGAFAQEKKAPDFTLPDLDGKPQHFAQLNSDKPVLISFWATWCVPCPQEMQHLQRFHQQYAKDGLRIVGISIDGTKTVSKVKPFVKGRGFTFPVLFDTNNDVMRLYQVSSVPSVCLVKPGGAIVFRHTGYKPGDEVGLEREIRAALGLPVEGSEAKAGDKTADDASSQDAAAAPQDSTRAKDREETAR